MAISHNLNSNGYLVHNEIWMQLQSSTPIKYFTVFVSSPTATSTQFIFYPDANLRAIFNLQSIVKSLMTPPYGFAANSSVNFNILNIWIGSDTQIASTPISRYFIRGGVKTINTNQTQSPNINLRISERLPAWPGYPAFDEYTEDYIVKTRIISLAENVDYRRLKGCNNCYIKFVNRKGGFSYWLFESFSERQTANNLGFNLFPSGMGAPLDLGNETKSELKLYSKIPREYSAYAEDLIVSPGVYIYDESTGIFRAISTKSNTFEFDDVKKVYAVTLNMDLHYRFNPSLLWTN